jgi:HD-GYP domain-containing protein (c-di-GMP phosphodiesterase class II)
MTIICALLFLLSVRILIKNWVTMSCMGNRKLILVEENPEFEDIYNLNFSAYLAMDVVACKDHESAIKELEKDPASLIVSRAKINGQDSAKELFSFVQKNKVNSQLITLGEMDEAIGDSTIVSSGIGLKTLIQTSAKKLNISAMDMFKLEVAPFFPIDINHFEKMEYSPFKVFMQDEKGQYLDLNMQNEYSVEKILRLRDQNIHTLFVEKNERLKMTDLVTEHLVSNINRDNLNDQEKIDHAEQSMHLLSGKLINAGLTKESVVLAASTLKSNIQNAKGKKGLRSLLKKLMENKHSYSFLHTQLLTYFGIQLMQILDWGDPDQMKKFCFVSLFHDILLIDDKLARIHTKEELKAANLDPEIEELVETHAQRASELVMRFPNSPLTTEVIIRQHHGTLNGKGFLTHASGNLTQLSTLFMVVEYFVELCLDMGNELNLDAAVQKVSERFSTSRFKPIIKALSTIASK